MTTLPLAKSPGAFAYYYKDIRITITTTSSRQDRDILFRVRWPRVKTWEFPD